MCTILYSPDTKLTVNVINVQQQDGFDDCGLHAIAMATDLCGGRDPVGRRYFQSRMRCHLQMCFEKCEIDFFPSTSRVPVANRIGHQCVVSVYCLCRKPDSLVAMACCDKCDMWYHEGCVPIPDNVLLDEHDLVPWICCQCKFLTIVFSLSVILMISYHSC